MGAKWDWCDWVFDTHAWERAVSEAVERLSVEMVAELIDVTPQTIESWAKMRKSSAYREFKHPSMHNFLKLCNIIDADPRKFWAVEPIAEK